MYSFLIWGGLGILVVGCDPKAKPDNHTDPRESTTSLELSVATWPVPLNAGKKWEMDNHTRNSIDRMKQLIEMEESATLGKSLAGEFHDLMKGCTMQGEAHNQLHVFLSELMPEILGMSEETSEEDFKTGKNRVRKLFKEYDLYFE